MAEEYRPNKHGCLSVSVCFIASFSVCESIRSPFLKQFFLWPSLFQLMDWSHIWHMYIYIYIKICFFLSPCEFDLRVWAIPILYVIYWNHGLLHRFFGHTQRSVDEADVHCGNWKLLDQIAARLFDYHRCDGCDRACKIYGDQSLIIGHAGNQRIMSRKGLITYNP